MKKLLLIGLFILFFFLLSLTEIQARQDSYCQSSSYLSLSCFQKPKGVGFKQRLFNNVYATGHLDYLSSSSDLEFQTGALYVLPRKFIIFRFYGGGGIQFSRNMGYQYPYLTLGTHFLFFFSEVVHPLERYSTPKYRLGLSFSF